MSYQINRLMGVKLKLSYNYAIGKIVQIMQAVYICLKALFYGALNILKFINAYEYGMYIKSGFSLRQFIKSGSYIIDLFVQALRFLQRICPPYKFNDALLGVEITPSDIYICQVNNKNGKDVLAKLACVCMGGKFVSEDILNNPGLYSEGLKKLIRDNKIRARKIAVSLPVSSSIVKVLTIAKMNDAEIDYSLKYGTLWQNLMSKGSPKNYSISYQIIRRNDLHDTMDILLVATRLADIKLYKDIVIKAGLKPIIIDAKSIAMHYALKARTLQSSKPGTILIELGLDENYIMVMGNSRPHIFPMDVSGVERVALFGHNGDTQIIDNLINRYSQKLNAIIASYNKMEIAIAEVRVMSSLPLVGSFVKKLGAKVNDCQVKECSMFDYLYIPDDFIVSKDSIKNNISAWAGAIGMTMFPWRERKEEWREVRKSPMDLCHPEHLRRIALKKIRSFTCLGITAPAYHIQYLRNIILSFFIKKDPSQGLRMTIINIRSTLARLAFHPTNMAMAAAVLSVFMIVKSYHGVIEDARRIASNDVALISVAQKYKEKTAQLVAMRDIVDKMVVLKETAEDISKDGNQQYVLSMYSYLDEILQQGVWLKQLTFTAPSNIEIEGRSLDDAGVVSFLGTMSGSKMFSKMALKHMQSIQERDLYALNSIALKSFVFKGNLSETLPGDYLNKPNLVAGGMGHGG